MLFIDDVREGDLSGIAATMRRSDLDEVAALRHSPLHALTTSVQVSSWSKVLRYPDGSPVCVFGLAPLGDGRGTPWMLGTTLITAHRKQFMAVSHAVVAKMLDDFPVLLNMVDSRNRTSIRWLRALGFFVDTKSVVKMPSGVDFYVFIKDRNV